MKFFKVRDYIGKSIKTVLLAAAIIVGMSGPAMAMKTPEMLMLFWGGGYVSTLETTDSLEMLDTLEMN